MRSILQDEKECYICGSQRMLECHHIFGGNPNRKLSEKYGLKVYLCRSHHTGNNGVHHNADTMELLHQIGQQAFENKYPELNFREIFGKNYL